MWCKDSSDYLYYATLASLTACTTSSNEIMFLRKGTKWVHSEIYRDLATKEVKMVDIRLRQLSCEAKMFMLRYDLRPTAIC